MMQRLIQTALLLFVIGFALPQDATAQGEATYAVTACERPGLPPEVLQRLTCGSLTVPRVWGEPDSGTFNLSVTIVEPLRPALEDPIILFPGGPGGTVYISAIPAVNDPLFENRRLILLDLRSTLPVLPAPCPETLMFGGALLGPHRAVDGLVDAAWSALRECLTRAEALGLRPEGFGSRVDARDIEALRRALGIARWNVFGISYGAVTAMTYVAAYPDGIRAQVLDSPVLAVGEPLGIQAKWQRVRANLLAACAGDPWCVTHYPDLGGKIDRLAQRLDDQSLPVAVPPFLGAPDNTLLLDGADLQFLLYVWSYDRTQTALIPAILDQLEAGRTEEFARQFAMSVATRPMSAFTFAAVHCRDGMARSESGNSLAGQPRNGAMILTVPLDRCGAWADDAASRVGDSLDQPIPTIVLSGSNDPITPPINAETVMQRVGPNARLYSFANVGHAAVAQSDCARRLVNLLLAEPPHLPDDPCIGREPHLSFAPPPGGQ